jgi:hypothetical protein
MNYNMDQMSDNNFMTYKQLINRLRKDLNNSDLDVLDLNVPHNEEEYQNTLSYVSRILESVYK